MKVIIACDGREPPSFFASLRSLAGMAEAEALVATICNPVLADFWEAGAGRHWLRRPGARERDTLTQVDQSEGRRIVEEAMATMTGWPEARRRTLILTGNPERELVKLVMAEEADLIAVGQHGTDLGPRSLGHCARFVVDHAPCMVLVVREPEARAAAGSRLAGKLASGPSRVDARPQESERP